MATTLCVNDLRPGEMAAIERRKLEMARRRHCYTGTGSGHRPDACGNPFDETGCGPEGAKCPNHEQCAAAKLAAEEEAAKAQREASKRRRR